jgi:hypothetical protein
LKKEGYIDMKLQVKFPFSVEMDGDVKVLLPGTAIESTKFDPKLIEGMKSRGFLVPIAEKLVEKKSEIPHGAVEVKFEKPADVVVAQPEGKKEEVIKAEEPKPVVEQPTRKGKANRN